MAPAGSPAASADRPPRRRRVINTWSCSRSRTEPGRTWVSASRRPRCPTCTRSPRSARSSATGPRRTPSRTASPSTSATISGVNNPNTVNDCDPSTTCRSTDDNLFRQVRVAGGTARNYVEGATTGCSETVTPPGTSRPSTSTARTPTRPAPTTTTTSATPRSAPTRELDVNNLPTFAWITPGPMQRRPRLRRQRRRLVGVDEHPARPRQRRLQGGNRRRLRLVRRGLPGAERADRAHLAQRQHHPARHRIARSAAKTIEDLLGLPAMNQGQLPGATNLRSILGM